jgi:RNA polymerase sigma-70 factor (ECF subfamily)
MLVRAHQEIAFRTAWLVTGSAAEAEDAAQDAFVKAWKALPGFRRGAPFRPWLLKIVANEARNRRRSAGRRAAYEGRAEAPPALPGPAGEGDRLAAEDRARLLAALAALREEDRLAVGCRFFLDLSEAETAAALGWRRGTVKSRLSRALARLRVALEEDA